MADRRLISKLVGGLTSVLAVVTIGGAGCALWEIQLASRFGHEPPNWIPLNGVYGAKAHAIVKTLEADPGVDLRPAKALSWRQLALSPANHYAWLRLAFIDVVENGNLTRQGVVYLQRSYDVAPYDSLAWRMNIAFETWPALSPDLRAAVIDDLKVNWRTNRRRRLYADLPRRVQNPQGLAALNAVLAELHAKDAERWRQEKLLRGL